MKKTICGLLAVCLLCSALSGCGSSTTASEESASNESTTSANKEILDLASLSSTLVYAEVYNMMVTPANFVGKMVRMKGAFTVYEDSTTHQIYYACIIADATACCQQGIEFVLSGDYTYPDDYPEAGSEITVTGEFQTYEEGEYTYCTLVNAEMSV